MSDFGTCIRKRMYKRAGIIPAPLCPKTAKTFNYGNIIHEFIQKIVKANARSAVKFLDSEIPYDDGKVSGHLDLLVEINGVTTAYELKSMHYLAMQRYMRGDLEKNLQQAYPHHHAQLNAYVHYMNKLGIGDAKILYICKSNMLMVEVPLLLPEISAAEEVELLDEAWKKYERDSELPEKFDSKHPRYWECNYCDYRNICRNKSLCDCEYCRMVRADNPLFRKENDS